MCVVSLVWVASTVTHPYCLPAAGRGNGYATAPARAVYMEPKQGWLRRATAGPPLHAPPTPQPAATEASSLHSATPMRYSKTGSESMETTVRRWRILFQRFRGTLGRVCARRGGQCFGACRGYALLRRIEEGLGRARRRPERVRHQLQMVAQPRRIIFG